MSRGTGAVIALGLGVFAAGFAVVRLLGPVLGGPVDGAGRGLTSLLVCLCLVGLAAISYVTWPSRWNLVAHTQVAFGLVAYALPILVMDVGELFPAETWNLYAQVVVIGFVAALVGAALAGHPGRGTTNLATKVADRVERASAGGLVMHRVSLWLLGSVAAVALCFAVMGFVPALANDPFAAKFFRGAYGEAYRPVAPLYRAGTSIIAVLLPLAAMFAWRRRTFGWVLLLGTSIGIMLLTLQRGPALGGVLLFAGVLAAKRAGRMPWYYLALLMVYVLGSALYYLAGLFGVGPMAGPALAGGFVASVAAGAPDVSDHLNLLLHWLARPELTLGRTFVGGLVPGNYEWNPSVWTLAVANPGADVTAISSGGFRLPPPLWGYVSFGWPGVLGVSLLYGWVVGRLANLARRIIPAADPETTVALVVVYSVVVELFSGFYAMSYITVIEAVAVMALFLVGGRRVAAPSAMTGSSASVAHGRGARVERPGHGRRLAPATRMRSTGKTCR